MSSPPVVVRDLRDGRRWLLAADGRATPAGGAPVARGVGLPWPEPFSAVYADGGTVWLRVGPRRWDLAQVAAVRLLEDGAAAAVYELDLAGGGTERVVVAFPPDVARDRATDPAHDEIASWDEDVLKVLPYTAPDGWSPTPGDTVAAYVARALRSWGGRPTPP